MRRACHATTFLYLSSAPSAVRGSASSAVMWEQPVSSAASAGSEPACRGASNARSVAGASSSPNKVGWVVSDDVDMRVWRDLRWGSKVTVERGNEERVVYLCSNGQFRCP